MSSFTRWIECLHVHIICMTLWSTNKIANKMLVPIRLGKAGIMEVYIRERWSV